ncbi:MAG: Crp/Fnr family transcriptional regulator [Verrucomicrobiaceae bacterium]|nr:Crp/Fnr family transcriptional regulator [Verrucomicrobiaceae bacterium]
MLPAVTVVNRLIDNLSSNERKQFLEQCTPVELIFGTLLCEADQPFTEVYFPLTSFISLVSSVSGHQPLEIGLIGSEGMLGATLALGILTAPSQAWVQGSGTALRMSANSFQIELKKNATLMTQLNRYLYVTMAQLSQIAACTHFHEIEVRLARWLLMAHDRAHADRFYLTHKFLADQLGVQRSAVTIAAGNLQKKHLISYTRGEIRILDRAGLEAAACECYHALIDDYARLIA